MKYDLIFRGRQYELTKAEIRALGESVEDIEWRVRFIAEKTGTPLEEVWESTIDEVDIKPRQKARA